MVLRSDSCKLKLGLSPCPNDTFIFHALLHGLVDTGGLVFEPVIEDVESLNLRAFQAELPVTKLSFHAFMKLRDRYELLDSGAAFGFGCGPLVVARDKSLDWSNARVAVPGIHTTACMLVQAWHPAPLTLEILPFNEILPAVRDGKVDAGVVIHEGRFVYEQYGCICLCDLGAWWEKTMQLPIPLGCIAVRKDAETLPLKERIETLIRESLCYARQHPEASIDYIRSLAGETDESVIRAHIDLYVNDYSLSLGEEGRAVIERMAGLL
jgi:1,4-dihydroxy-6-naphthoate synthase